MSNQGGESDATGARGYGAIGGSFGVNMPGIDTATAQVAKLTGALNNLQVTMQKIQSSAAGFTQATNNITKGLSSMSGASGGGSTTYGKGNGGFSGIASSLFGPATQSGAAGVARDLALFPARFIQGQVQNNRNVVNAAGSQLGMQSFASNTNLQGMLQTLSQQMGGVMGGNPQDLLNLMSVSRSAGAGLDWRYYDRSRQQGPQGMFNQPRAAGFLESMRQGQLMNPGGDLTQMAGTVGGFLANVGAQKQSAFLTGGAFAMVGSGNKAKSISEWAEGILKWFMNQRPGAKRGKPFNYGELMSQNFPGSNMDAWFEANGVPGDMREYFWTYAMGKASSTGTTGGEAILGQGAATPPVTQQNPIYQRLAAGNAATRQSFNLGGKLTGMYGNMEQSNRWFAELMGQMQGTVLPGALASGPLSWMQYLPDEMREMLMSLAERTNIGAAGAGVLGWGSLAGMDKLFGDVGDVGDYGPNGTSGMAGMHPDMRKRVAAMMRANPNLSITSGHRDLAKQQTLKRKGGNRVSGKPSAHTRGMAADIGPASQYGWLVQNAGRFGLKSGIGAGEPWHVGMGDPEGVGDAASGLMDVIKNLFSGLVGGIGGVVSGNPQQQMEGIAGGTTSIMKVLLGMFAQPNANLDNLQFRDVYSTMVGATKDALKAGLPVTAAGTATGGAAATSPAEAFTPDNLGRAKAAAVALNKAGFTGNDLFKILSISGRESGWDPHAKNKNTSDRGLMQMNWGAHKSWLIASGIADSEEDLWQGPDAINVNARAAYELWHNRMKGSWEPWKASDSSQYVTPKGSPGWDKHGDELWHTESKQPIARKAIEELHLGDVDYAYGAPTSTGGGSVRVTFNNTFKIDSGSGGGGIDVRRTVNLVADQLENEMRQRMAGNN